MSHSRILLSADALFAFDSAELTPAGRTEVATLADQLEYVFDAPDLLAVGHTGHLGSEGYNLRLSQYRADAVRRELIDQGIAQSSIRSLGVGEQEPVASCERGLPTPDLKACLQPDRRVEVRVLEGAPLEPISLGPESQLMFSPNCLAATYSSSEVAIQPRRCSDAR